MNNEKVLTRYYNKKWLGKLGVKFYKADYLVGGLIKTDITIREGKCSICDIKLYFADIPEEHPDLIKKEAKYICPNCVLKSDKIELNQEQRKMLMRWK